MKYTIKPLSFLAAVLLALGSLAGDADAAVIITIEGVPGSSSFTISGSGTNTVLSSVASANTAFLRIPSGSAWTNPFTATFGDILVGNPEFFDLIASSGAVTLSISGSQVFSRPHDGLRVFASNADRFALTSVPASDLPALVPGDSVTLSGTASFTLPSGTFDTTWRPGTYVVSPAADGGSYTIQINAIPEPSTALFLGCSAFGLVARRRRTPQVNP